MKQWDNFLAFSTNTISCHKNFLVQRLSVTMVEISAKRDAESTTLEACSRKMAVHLYGLFQPKRDICDAIPMSEFLTPFGLAEHSKTDHQAGQIR